MVYRVLLGGSLCVLSGFYGVFRWLLGCSEWFIRWFLVCFWWYIWCCKWLLECSGWMLQGGCYDFEWFLGHCYVLIVFWLVSRVLPGGC